MRKLTTIFIISFLPLLVVAQTFLHAPKKGKTTRQIIEWTTFAADTDAPEETIKEGVHTFRRDGQLQQFITNNDLNEVFTYEYDNQNRLTKVQIKNDERTRTLTYQYFSDHQTAEIKEPGTNLRTIQYFNKKGQVIEEKSFWKGELSNGEWATMSRTVFNYDLRDSLFGEMLYQTGLDGSVEKHKTVHQYDPVSHKKTAIIFSEPSGKERKRITFQYDAKGRLVKEVTTVAATGNKTIVENIYRDGQLWQSISKGENYRTEKIYKAGRLIRSKEYDETGKLLWYTDYQYIPF